MAGRFLKQEGTQRFYYSEPNADGMALYFLGALDGAQGVRRELLNELEASNRVHLVSTAQMRATYDAAGGEALDVTDSALSQLLLGRDITAGGGTRWGYWLLGAAALGIGGYMLLGRR